MQSNSLSSYPNIYVCELTPGTDPEINQGGGWVIG